MLEQEDSPQILVIAGPARCGKTTLAAILERQQQFIGFKEDALLHILFEQGHVPNDQENSNFLLEHLKRPRIFDKKEKTSSKPIDSFDVRDLNYLSNAADQVHSSFKPIVFAHSFLELVKEKKRKYFFSSDIHTEFIADKIWNFFENAKVIVVLRDPRSSIAASLYWENYPERTRYWRRDLFYRLLMWCLSVAVSERHLASHQGKIEILTLKDLGREKKKGGGCWRNDLVIYDDDCKDFFFDFDCSTGLFRSLDGSYTEFLSKSECDFILLNSSPWLKRANIFEKPRNAHFLWHMRRGCTF